jgi:tRNA (guanine37-N1)-methyltransferase
MPADMRFDILTIFPNFFTSIFEHGVVRRATANGLVKITAHDLRSFTRDRHRTVDDRPFGGGEGMVLKPEPIAEALASLKIQEKASRDRESVVLLSAQGRPFNQTIARDLACLERVVLICGRYEGVDERVNELFCDRELSIGDYVLSGGELAAAVVVDSTMRLLPGVLGNEASSAYESFGQPDADLVEATTEGEDGRKLPSSVYGAGGLLDYPHYTRPVEFQGLTVPEILAGGNHEEIRRWRRQKALEKTLLNRPDLLEDAVLSAEDREHLQRLRSR